MFLHLDWIPPIVNTADWTQFGTYHYVNLPMTWTDAQHYCREKHTDLVTIESADDFSSLNRPSTSTAWSWIGLTDDPKSWKGVMGNDVNSWRWSATGETAKTDYQSWYYTEPNNIGGHQKCVFVKRQGTWADQDCSVKLAFVCFNVKPMEFQQS
uniref:C-type lectin domain-containing protein n=1 Tax=Seriola dumerili TaxID=41447 RepID=A0A3B4UC98_SERDU